MEKIKKIIQLGSHDGSTWETDGKVVVIFDDASIAPVVVPNEDGYKVYEEYARQNKIQGNLKDVIAKMAEDGQTLSIANTNDPIEMSAVQQEVETARRVAMEHSRENEGAGLNPPTPTPVGRVPSDVQNPPQNTDVITSEELVDKVKTKKSTGKRLAAATLAALSAGGIGYGIYNLIKNVGDDDITNEDEDKIDFDTADFADIMEAMDENDSRRIVSETAMNLVEGFHNATHKDGNFRLQEDAESYLDLSYEEALVLATFANYSEPTDLYNVLGDYDINSVTAQDLLESARTKIITYYMNAVEPSGLAEIFKNEQDKEFFSRFESEVIKFNAEHDTGASDQVLRDVYYSYVLDGATNYATVNPMAKLLSFDTVYGGLNLVESASKEHAKFLEFHGKDTDTETRYYIENVLHLDYISLSDEEIAKYRKNIIEKGTDLMQLSTSKKSDDASITELVDQMGICNANNEKIVQAMAALDTLSATKNANLEVQFTTINTDISRGLRSAGLDELANRVDASINSMLDEELLNDIRSASRKASSLVENYENVVSTITDQDRPTMVQIINAADRKIADLNYYAGDSKDVATLINNRRHVVVQKDTSASKDGYLGPSGDKGIDGKDIPVYAESSVPKDKEEQKDFIIEHGVEIEEPEETEVIEEFDDEEQLTEEEKKEVEEQKPYAEAEALAKAGYASSNASEAGKRDANKAFSTFRHSLTGIVYDMADATGSTYYDLSTLSLQDAISHMVAYSGSYQFSPEYNDYIYVYNMENPNYKPDIDMGQFYNAAVVAADEYSSRFSAAEVEALENVMGPNWRDVIENAYVSGYISQIQAEIDSAIDVGKGMGNDSIQAYHHNLTVLANANANGSQDTNNNGYNGAYYGNNGQSDYGQPGNNQIDNGITGNGSTDENGNYYDSTDPGYDPNLDPNLMGNGEEVYTGGEYDENGNPINNDGAVPVVSSDSGMVVGGDETVVSDPNTVVDDGVVSNSTPVIPTVENDDYLSTMYNSIIDGVVQEADTNDDSVVVKVR